MKRKKMIWTAGILLGVGLLMKTAGMPESPIVKLKSEAAVSSRETNLSDNETEETAALREQTAENKQPEQNQTAENGQPVQGQGVNTNSAADGDAIHSVLQAPTRYRSKAEDLNGRLKILTDAVVEVPDVNKVSSVAVRPHSFEQPDIDKITEAFFGEADVYDAKAYIQEKTLQKLEKPYIFEQEQIDAWDKTRGVTNKVYGAAISDNGACFRYDLEKRDRMPMSVWIKRVSSFDQLDDVNPYGWFEYDSMKSLYEWVPEKKALREMIGISKKEAQNIADEMAAKLDLPDMQASVCEYVIELDRKYQGAPQKENMINAGYVFHYTRNINEMPVTYTMESGGRPETFDVYVTKDGIDEISLSNLYETGEIKTENLELLPFADIMAVFEKMMAVRSTGLFQDERGSGKDVGAPVQTGTYYTKKIKLGYMRICSPQPEQNQDVLIPVWDFFGEYDLSYDGVHTTRVKDAAKSFLTIHAVDGIVIDRAAGY